MSRARWTPCRFGAGWGLARLRRRTPGALTGELRRTARAGFTAYLALVGLAASVLTPLSAWLLGALLRADDRVIISNQGLLGFALGPLGLLWLGIALAFALLLVYLQQACVSELTSRRAGHPVVTAAGALLHVGHRLPQLLALIVVQVGTHLLLLAPALLLLDALGAWLLRGDVAVYLLERRPPRLWAFMALAAPVALAALALQLRQYLRWVLALPLIVVEDSNALVALRRSRVLMRGLPWRPCSGVLLSAAALLGLPLLMAWGLPAAGAPLLGGLPLDTRVVVPAAVGFVSLSVLLGLLAGYLGLALHALAVMQLYRAAGGHPPPPPPAPMEGRARLAGVLELGVLALVIFQAGSIVRGFEQPEPPAITAHRGASATAPENTLAAIRAAITAGANFVEVDVRQTADGVLVLMHDASLQRTAGVARPVAEVTLEELRAMEVGGWFDPAFMGKPVPTLEDAIEAVRGRAQLYVEIKPSPFSPGLTGDVVSTLQAAGFVDQSVVASMYPAVIAEARSLEPELRTTLFVQLVLGSLDRSGFDALGLRHNRVNPAQVAAARQHGHELHAWTVNRDAEMSRLLTLGVDNIITDRPARLAELRAEHARLGPAERLLVQLRHWLQR